MVRPNENEYVFIWIVILSLWRNGYAHHTGTSPLATLAFVCLYPPQTSPTSHVTGTRHCLSFETHEVILILGIFYYPFLEHSSCRSSHRIHVIYIPQPLPHPLAPIFTCHDILVWYSLFYYHCLKISYLFSYFSLCIYPFPTVKDLWDLGPHLYCPLLYLQALWEVPSTQ